MGKASSEDDFISRWFAPIAGTGGLALRDDAALYTPPPDADLVLTVDTLVAGVHFLVEDPPASIARKALRVNLSDIAAKGAEPGGFVLSFAMPADARAPMRTEAWLGAFSQALGEDARAYACPLLGGDTVTTPGPLTLSITVFGHVPKGKMARRTGARAGDAIFVTGTIGDAALGLHLLVGEQPAWADALSAEQQAFLVSRYREPQPRNALARFVREHAHGAMDVSDGLAGDLAKMMRVSGVQARVELERVPLSAAGQAAMARDASILDVMITGGDDYEILCTVAPEDAVAFALAAQAAGVAVTQIGQVLATGDSDAVFVDGQGRPRVYERGSYSHF